MTAAPGFAKHPDYQVTFTESPKRVRVMFGGETVVDSLNARLVHETRHLPVYYFPQEDVRMDLLRPGEASTFCPFKGEASYWSVEAGGKVAEDAVWSYRSPYRETAWIKDWMAFYWDRMDHWYEEDEEVFVHARDPFVRVDVLESRRQVVVRLAGETLADTTRARFLFETGLPTRYYIPREDVRMDLLTRSDSRTACPYKGTASYFSAEVAGRRIDDVAWVYDDPRPEVGAIRDLLCFYPEKVDVIEVSDK